MKRNRWLTGLSAAIFAAGFSFFMPLSVQAQEGTLPFGIRLGDEELGGMTETEAKKAVEEYIKEFSGQTVTLDVDGTDVTATMGELGIYWENTGVLKETIGQYEKGNILQRFFAISDLKASPVQLELETAVDKAAAAGIIEERCSELMTEAKDAAIVREDGKFTVTPSVTGLTVDTGATMEAIDQALAGGINNPLEVTAVIVKEEPARRTEDLETIGDLLGQFTTSFSTSGPSRSTNIRVGASKINGHVLMPGETLSGYECMQPFTTANGYATAAAYENGKVIDSVGGGVCQIATTLYNTALLAEMDITQRQNHSMIVTYVKPSMDAAIAGTVKDIKITNPYDTPIYVEGYTTGKNLTFAIYGKETRPMNRTIKYVSETLSVTDPGAPEEQVDASMAPGARKQVQSAHKGLKSRLWKYVYIDGVEKEKILLHDDTYNPSKAIIKVGPAAPAAAPPEEVTGVPEGGSEPSSEEPNSQQPSGPSGDGGGPGSRL